jgi:hypothetical protein
MFGRIILSGVGIVRVGVGAARLKAFTYPLIINKVINTFNYFTKNFIKPAT